VPTFAAVENVTIHYSLDGLQEGLPLVFINSLGTDLRLWDKLIPHFAESYRIIRYDKRGHGLSDAPPGPYSIRDQATVLGGLLTYLQVRQPVLIGISVGGMIALDYAATQPDNVRALVLCDTGAKIGSLELWNARITAVRNDGMASIGEDVLARWFTPNFIEPHPAEYRGYLNMLVRTSVIGYAATCEAIRDADLTNIVHTITTKSLVLCGSEDAATPPSLNHELAEALPDARFELIEHAAHLPPIEQPATTAAKIKQFLQEIRYVR
jgi:3-oxoadipate enol-lactonase